MKENFTFQQKTKLLTKLFDAGCNTEKKLQQLDCRENELKKLDVTNQKELVRLYCDIGRQRII